MLLPADLEKERTAARVKRKLANLKRYKRRYEKTGRRNQERRFWHFIKSKPPVIRQLAERFRLNRVFYIDDQRHWLVGYNESGMLLLTHIDPTRFYDEACKQIKYICASHFSEGVRR